MNNFQTEKETTVPLLDEESSIVLKGEYGITSITFYRGDRAKATAAIRARVREIVDVNPWLVGRLVKNKQHKNVQLVYPSAPLSDDMIERLFHDNPSQIHIGSEMGYEELFKASKSAIVKKGFKTINKPDIITRITIVPDMHCPEDGFALIFSISHIAADGYSYYQVLNSLFDTGTVQPLLVNRKQEAADKVVEVVGKKAFNFFHSIPFFLNMLKGFIFGKKVKCYAFYVDPDKIKVARDEIIANPTVGVDFISTNDILTSSFARTVDARICIMAVNLRSWIKEINSNDVGNYDGGLLFDEGTCARPSNIRKAFQSGLPILSTAKPLPGFWETVKGKICLISNWSDLQGNLVFDGCEQRFHLPLYPVETFPCDSAVVFKALPDKLAVMYFTKTVGRDKLLLSCELSESVSTKMFQ